LFNLLIEAHESTLNPLLSQPIGHGGLYRWRHMAIAVHAQCLCTDSQVTIRDNSQFLFRLS